MTGLLSRRQTLWLYNQLNEARGCGLPLSPGEQNRRARIVDETHNFWLPESLVYAVAAIALCHLNSQHRRRCAVGVK